MYTYYYNSGGNGTLIARSDGCHADTVSGDAWNESGQIHNNEAIHEYAQELSDASIGTPNCEKAREYAENCVYDDILEKHSDIEDAIAEYVGA